MLLLTNGGVLSPGQLFRTVALGYAIGVVTIFGPIVLLVSVLAFFGTPLGEGGKSILLLPILLPVIAAIQGVIFGSVCVLGLVIYGTKRQIIIAEQGGQPNKSLERTREG